MTVTVSKDRFDASRPDASAWVSANAGSGKTFVLVTRLVSLLLSGSPPEKLLCLTYTRSAAAEMQERLFQLLGSWAVMPETELKAAMTERLGQVPSTKDMDHARIMFARALETPGGIKVQTIHAFCESLLNRFPLEAGITPGFRVIDDRLSASLVEEARNDILAHADGALRNGLDRLTRHLKEDQFDDVIAEIIRHRDWFKTLDFTARIQALQKSLGLEAALDVAVELEAFFKQLSADEARALADVYADETAAVPDKSELFLSVAGLLRQKPADQEAAWQILEAFFLTREGEKRKSLITAKLLKAFPAWGDKLTYWQDLYAETADRIKLAFVYEMSLVVYDFAEALLLYIEHIKQERNLLDYDDLIEKTVTLVSDSQASAWVLYKLDGGLDHILVDEAQDTSPTQWRVITALAEEFFSGETARETTRTVFAVGDEKQSIFSFQGADPKQFDAMRAHFEKASRRSEQAFYPVDLEKSYRTVSDILGLVDKVAQIDCVKDSLTAQKKTIIHQAFREQKGLVELWAYEKGESATTGDYWSAHTTSSAAATPRSRLAERIANKIRTMVDDPEQDIRPKDILILVQNRDAFVEDMIRALKKPDIGIPVAGSDRMALTKQIAVMDLLAAARAALLPKDDLMLATFLRSPLGGISEEQLFDLCHGPVPEEDTGPTPLLKKTFLCDRLAEAVRNDTPDPVILRAWERFTTLCRDVNGLAPFEFFSALIEGGGGRADLKARLGQEVDDPVDELLSLALDFERQKAPSVEAFIHWVENSESEVKRDMEQALDAVRIMTVHGAKGLEAPIVFLPDTCRQPFKVAGAQSHIQAHDSALLYRPNKGRMPLLSKVGLEALRAREQAEHKRLLYVALTRARDRVYICGHIGVTPKVPPAQSWYSLVAGVIKDHPETEHFEAGDEFWRLGQDRPLVKDVQDPPPQTAWTGDIPDWLHRPAKRETRLAALESPSHVLGVQGAAKQTQLAGGAALLRGNLTHDLLEGLAGMTKDGPVDKAVLVGQAAAFLKRHGAAFSEMEQAQMVSEALAVIFSKELAGLFGPDSRAELPIAGRIAVGNGRRRFSGRIDRYVENENAVIIADYKTNRVPPRNADDIPKAYLAQMAVYQALLAGQTDKPVRCLLIWTVTGFVQRIPDEMMHRILTEIP